MATTQEHLARVNRSGRGPSGSWIMIPRWFAYVLAASCLAMWALLVVTKAADLGATSPLVRFVQNPLQAVMVVLGIDLLALIVLSRKRSGQESS